MAIFSKRKSADKGKDKPVEPQAPKERTVYVPRYAARDGLIGAPTGVQAEEEQEAFKRAYAARMTRENSEMSLRHSMNPKMSPRLSRNSSSMSFEWGMPSSSSAKQSNPFASGRSSFQSLPALVRDDPPVPAIPNQYASQASSVGAATPLSHSRNSSFHENPARLQPNYSYSKPREPQRRSAHMAPSPLGRTPETSHEVSPVDSVDHSSASSTASSSSGEAIEIQTKHDSPAQYMIDRAYPNDPRAFGAAPMMNFRQEEAPRKYFGHGTKPEVQAPAPVAAPKKKSRFSMMKRSPAVAAH